MSATLFLLVYVGTMVAGLTFAAIVDHYLGVDGAPAAIDEAVTTRYRLTGGAK